MRASLAQAPQAIRKSMSGIVQDGAKEVKRSIQATWDSTCSVRWHEEQKSVGETASVQPATRLPCKQIAD